MTATAPPSGSGRGVLLPLVVGFVAMMLIAIGAGVAAWRIEPEGPGAPRVALDYQERLTDAAAQSMRRSLNQGVDDLVQLAQQHVGVGAAPASFVDSLNALVEAHDRYLAAYVLDEGGSVVAAVGDEPQPDRVATELAAPTIMPMEPGSDTVLQAAPVDDGAVAAHYDLDFLRFSTDWVVPGDAWVFDADGAVVWQRASASPDDEITATGVRAAAGEPGARAAGNSVIAFAPLAGEGPAGMLGWSLVTAREVDTLPTPTTDAQRVGYTTALVLGIVTVIVFGWAWSSTRPPRPT